MTKALSGIRIIDMTHNQVRDRYRAAMRRLEEFLGGKSETP